MSAAEKKSDAEKQSPASMDNTPEPAEPQAPVAQSEVDSIIRKRVYAAVALGLAPLPLVDLIGLYAIQVELVRALAKKYGVPFKSDKVKTLLFPLIGSVMPVSAVPVLRSMFRMIPVIGWTASATATCIAGGASTYAVGWVFDRHFASGGTLLQADTEKLRTAFKEKYEEGKKFVGKIGKKGEGAAPEAAEANPA
jgi:uncharacterized protein (DUF697 family)